MSFVSHAADAMDAVDHEDDVARVAESERVFLGRVVSRLLEVDLPKGSPDARFLEQMDLRLNVQRERPSAPEIDRLKALAWAQRRRMPRPLRPTLPPHDPIVQELKLG